MIIGNGIDIIEVKRVKKNLENDKFINRIFTLNEIKYLKKRKMNAQTAAGIFSAKEAVSKCLGTGISGFNWKDIEICKNTHGKPYVLLHNNAYEISKKLNIDNILVSITHIKEMAIAFAIAEGKERNDIKIIDFSKRDYSTLRALKHIRKRKSNTHKGTYGKIAVIAGSIGMTGASYLSSKAALRTGSGLVYTLVPKELVNIMSIKLTEAVIKPINDDGNGFFISDGVDEIMSLIDKCDAVLIGPGLGTRQSTKEMIYKIVKNTKKPLLIDADGLNCIAGKLDILKERKAETVITPHIGEMKRLIEKKTINYEKKVILTREFSYKYNVVTVLKGNKTVIASPKGEYFINTTGNPGMATAGSGDVLSGIITSLIGQGIDCFNAATCGAFIHGLAGDIGAENIGEYGLLAEDIMNNIPYAIKNILEFEGSIE